MSGTVAVLLPDDWVVLDLEDEAARTACIEDLVAHRLGGVPDLAPLRAAMRQELLRSTEQAARAGGVLMALAVGTGGTPPVPASLTVYRVPGSLDTRGRVAMTSRTLQIVGVLTFAVLAWRRAAASRPPRTSCCTPRGTS